LPDRRISGTSNPSYSLGLVYCGYSTKFSEKVSKLTASSFFKNPGMNLEIVSININAGISPP